MLNKSSATLFLSISAWLSCLLIISHHLVVRAQYGESEMSLISWVNLLVIIGTYVVLGLFGLSLYNNNENLRKNVALTLAISAGLWSCIDLYNMFDNADWLNRLSDLDSWVELFRFRLFLFITPLALMLTGIAFYGTNNQRRKKALVWLLIGGLTYLFADLSNLAVNFYFLSGENRMIDSMGSEFYDSIRQILNILSVSFSVALIAFAINSYSKLDTKTTNIEEVEHENTLDKWEKIRTVSVLSPMQWLGNFLLAAIPLAGLIMLIIWGSDHQNRIRRNWAIMQFWASTFGVGLNLLVIGGLMELSFSDQLSGLFALTIGFFIVMVIIASVLTHNYFQQKTTFEDDQNPNLGTWLGNFVIIAIPIIGIIMLIVWATDSTKELIRKWAIAQLIWLGISFIMWVYLYSVYETIQNTLPFQYFQF